VLNLTNVLTGAQINATSKKIYAILRACKHYYTVADLGEVPPLILGDKTKNRRRKKSQQGFFTIYGYITNSQHDQLPVGLIAQLAEHCTGIAEVMGWNTVES